MVFSRFFLPFSLSAGFVYFFSRMAFAILPASVPGVSISNVHLLAEAQGKVYRGAQPLGKEQELLKLGITDVLIFKNQLKTEVSDEKKALRRMGIQSERIHDISFGWKNKVDERVQCEQIIQGLQQIVKIYHSSGRAIYFHCTVGEDRTGLLAGLFQMLIRGTKADEAFSQELCARGYEAGNENKPGHVVDAIRSNLTPIFLKMAQLIQHGDLHLSQLDEKVCRQLPQIRVQSSAWKCQPRQ